MRIADNGDKLPLLGTVQNGGVSEYAIDFWLGKKPRGECCNNIPTWQGNSGWDTVRAYITVTPGVSQRMQQPVVAHVRDQQVIAAKYKMYAASQFHLDLVLAPYGVHVVHYMRVTPYKISTFRADRTTPTLNPHQPLALAAAPFAGGDAAPAAPAAIIPQTGGAAAAMHAAQAVHAAQVVAPAHAARLAAAQDAQAMHAGHDVDVVPVPGVGTQCTSNAQSASCGLQARDGAGGGRTNAIESGTTEQPRNRRPFIMFALEYMGELSRAMAERNANTVEFGQVHRFVFLNT